MGNTQGGYLEKLEQLKKEKSQIDEEISKLDTRKSSMPFTQIDEEILKLNTKLKEL